MGNARRTPGTVRHKRTWSGIESLETRQLLSGNTESFEDPVAAGDVSQGAWVKRLYLDVLGRPAVQAETDYWIGRLQSGVTRSAIAESIINGRERRSAVIDDYYEKILGRNVDPSGLEFWLNVWTATGGPETVRASLIGSGEYFQKAGGTSEGATQKLYNDILHRSATSAEMAYWLPILQSTPLANVAFGFITSDEFRRTSIEEWYSAFLHRTMDAGADQYWIARMKGGVSQSQIQASLLGGIEYANQPYFDIRSFGANANDATEDTAAIQAAIDAASNAGNSLVYIPSGVFLVDYLRILGSNQKLIGKGTLKLKSGSTGQAVVNVGGSHNVVAMLTIDGNASGHHLGEAEGLIVYGHYNHIFNVTVSGTATVQDGSPLATGSNIVVAGNYNRIEETLSTKAGYSNYKQVGEANRYINIVSRDARVKGFTGKGDGTSFTIDGGYFSIETPPESDGATSFQIDPGPTRYLSRVQLRNLTVIGPAGMNNTSSAAKIALVNDLLIENSRFHSTTESMSSLRFAESVGRITMRNVFMNHSLFVQQDSTAVRVLDSLYMENVTIGDGTFRPNYAMQYVKTGILTMVNCRMTNYGIAAIQWETPATEYSRIAAINTVFEGIAAGTTTFDIRATGIGQLDAARMQWTGVQRYNLGGGGSAFTG